MTEYSVLPRAERTPYFAIEEAGRHIRDFLRGMAGANGLSIEDRLQCLSEAWRKLDLAYNQIARLPNYIEYPWLLDALKAIAHAQRDLFKVSSLNSLEHKLLTDPRQFSYLVERVAKFWEEHRDPLLDVMEKVGMIWGEIVNRPHDAENAPTPTHTEVVIPMDGGDIWERVTHAAGHAYEVTQFKNEGYWKTKITRCCNTTANHKNHIVSNGKTGNERRVSRKSLESYLTDWYESGQSLGKRLADVSEHLCREKF